MTHDKKGQAPLPGRRKFLSGTAALAGLGLAAGAAPAFVQYPRPVGRRGKSFTPVRQGEALRIGVVGVGGMGTGHCNAMLNQRDAGKATIDLVAVSDVATPRMDDIATKASERQGFEVAKYQDYKQLLARDDIHGILCACPEHWHAQVAIDAVMAGKDVYCEKPMTYDLADGLRLKAAVDANDQIVQVGTQKMMVPKFAEAKKLLAAGAIGKPVWSQTSYCRNSPDGEWNYYGIDKRIQPGTTLDWEKWCEPLGLVDWDPLIYHRWRRYSKYSTGIIGDLLVHEMTPLVWALDAGWPVKVQAIGGHYIDKEMDNFDQVNLTIQFDSEHTMIVAGSTCNENGLETVVRGNMADMYLGSNNVEIVPQRPYVDDIEKQTVACAGVSDQDELRLNWFHSMRTREPNRSPVDLALRIMVIVDLAHRSMWDGHAYSFDPAEMRATRI